MDETAQGNTHTVRTPIIKYPYLPLSTQLCSILKISGLKGILDLWCHKDHTDSVYSDIFDGNICHRHLKAPDSWHFFCNLPHEKNGPNGKLHIGVNLGMYIINFWAYLTVICYLGSLIFTATLHHPIPLVQCHSQYVISHQNTSKFLLLHSDWKTLPYSSYSGSKNCPNVCMFFTKCDGPQ